MADKKEEKQPEVEEVKEPAPVETAPEAKPVNPPLSKDGRVYYIVDGKTVDANGNEVEV